ncbi:unnamed protein product [Lupinus luteus]|uniref:Uncharacterized protein n=1 Tax=Lupinus luteus TaxID=3873 RepID=A0AAV1XDU8_LUPLU
MEIAFPIHDFHGSRGPHPRLSKNNTRMRCMLAPLVNQKKVEEVSKRLNRL